MPHYENVPFEVPSSWVWTTGNEIFLPLKSCIPQGDRFIYVDIDAIDNKVNVISNPKIIQTVDAPSRATRYTQAGDVLFSMVRPYLRNIAIVPENGWIASTGFYVCSPSKSLLSQYCFYLMLSDYVVDGLNQYMKGDNSPSINYSHITSWFYPIPPLTEQKRIVSEIKRWFTLINRIEQGKLDLQETIKQTKNKILELAIHGKLVSQDPSDEPASELLKRINPKAEFTCDNAHSKKLPRGWCFCKYKDIFFDVSSKPYQILQSQIQTHGVYPVISQSINYIEGYSNSCNVFNHNEPCIIFGDHTRVVKYVDFNFIVGADGVKILCPKVNTKWGYYIITYVASQIENKGYSRHYGQLLKFKYLLPPKSEQIRIVQKIEDLFASLDKIQKALEV